MWKWETKDVVKGAVIMVHGAGEYHGRYEWLIQQFNAAGFHVLMGDLPGQGTTTRRRGHIDSFDEYILTIEEWITEAELYSLPVFLFGHSMGGLAAIRAATERNFTLKCIILSSPCLGLASPPKKGIETLSRVLNTVAPSIKFSANLDPVNKTRNEQVLLRDASDPLLVEKVSVRWYRELVSAMKQAHQETDRFPNVPLLVIQGGDDRIVDKRAVRSWFNRLELHDKMYKEYPGLYHEVLNEPERDDVFKFMKSYLNLHF
ncbi:alpha/beta hydrolase [Fictibacillus enclensis]|uniref:alpha/beta hydrolase n=1 Tax=Fictibacillus enclensis TaxID=1017270 RepID=UPI0024C0C1D7|nr:alpha/beta hydrolase [Fictibacillus enclensis]WHY70908.1 alpha/beta hydrolase [Fictibacillus enclensis]